MRLIDADKLHYAIDINAYRHTYIDQIHAIIDDAPTIDAVQVVRCKDCKHANECHKSVQYTRNEPNTITIGYSPIEWCSKGERSE